MKVKQATARSALRQELEYFREKLSHFEGLSQGHYDSGEQALIAKDIYQEQVSRLEEKLRDMNDRLKEARLLKEDRY